jgi:polysaccharide biosynthesis transport protein
METIVSTLPSSAGYQAPGRSDQKTAAVIDLRGLFEVIRRRRRLIVRTAILFVTAALIYLIATPIRYTATTQLLLDPSGLQIVSNDLTPRPVQSEVSLAEVESQLQVALSEVVLSKVVELANLANDPEFGEARDGWLRRLLALVVSRPSESNPALKALRILQQRIDARRPEKTLVLNISVWTEDGAKSARIANATAQAYLEQESAAKAAAAQRTNASLVAQLSELSQQVVDADKRVEQYKVANKIVSSGGQLVNEQQLTEMNRRLVAARERTALQAARYQELERLRRDRASPDAFVELTDSATFMALRTKYAEAKQAEATALTILGPRHPGMKAAIAQVETARKLVDEEIARVARAAQSDLNRSRANEAALESNLEALKRQASETNASLVKLRELEREADSSRTVYVALLTRAKEVSEQKGLEKSNARVITHALPPPDKSNPSRVLVVGSALALGLFCGLGLGLLSEQFDSRLYSSSQIVDQFGLPVLAALPRASGRAARLGLAALPNRNSAAPIRQLRDALRESTPMNETRLVLITSPQGLNARSLVAADLAQTGAADGERVLLIDADQERRLTSTFGESGTAGFREVLTGRVILSGAVVKTPWQGVDLLTAGPGMASEQARQLRQLPREAITGQLRAFDLVVVDGRLPPSDLLARNFSSLIDDVVIVIQSGITDRSELAHMLDSLSAAKMNIRGAVLVDAPA